MSLELFFILYKIGMLMMMMMKKVIIIAFTGYQSVK